MMLIETIQCLLLVVFVHVLAQDVDYCDLSCGDDEINIACERAAWECEAGPDCDDFKEIPLYTVDREFIVDLHNFYRNKVAMGNEERGDQPAAANMMALGYDKDLAFLAQCLTNSCKYAHDKCRRTKEYKHVGQNIASFGTTATSANKTRIIENSIEDWYDEVQYYNQDSVDEFRSSKSGTKVIAHYTQLVWAETKEIGCGMTRYASGKWTTYFFACNYGPGGNTLGESVYIVGEPRSQCPNEISNEEWPGLC